MPVRFRRAACVLLLATSGAARADVTLNVFHTNDLHSRIEPINGFDSTCSPQDAADSKCFGGFGRLATRLAELRAAAAAAGEAAITLNAGDLFQGSLMYTVYKGAAEAELTSAIGFDAMVLGNHEFDDGPGGLAAFLPLVNYPVIAGNTDVSRADGLQAMPARVLLDLAGLRVGIVGAVTTDTAEIASPGPTVVFEDEIESLRADVAELQADGVEIIIALTHVGYARDLEIAAAVPGLDAVVGGHSHTYLSATDPARAGPYPTWVSAADGSLVPVVQAYAYSKYLGHLVLTFDDAGALVFAQGNTLLLDASVVPDPAIEARIAELAAPIAELKNRVIGETGVPIDGAREVCRVMECAMGNLVADAMLDRVKAQGIAVAIQNGGGLRASIDAGPVTMGEVLTVLPFQNTLATFRTTGADLLAALENGVSQVEDGAGRFPQVAGLRYTFDPAAAVGARISKVSVAERDGFAPLDPAKLYGVVTNNYVRGGGDGFRSFAANAQDVYDFGPDLADVLAEYIARTGPVAPVIDGRISRR